MQRLSLCGTQAMPVKSFETKQTGGVLLKIRLVLYGYWSVSVSELKIVKQTNFHRITHTFSSTVFCLAVQICTAPPME